MKVSNFFNYVVLYLILKVIAFKKVTMKERTLLLIRLDAIGDYILFRNFIESIKKSTQYRNYKITLCGNKIWKELSEIFDQEYVDDFIWIDRKKFYNEVSYKFNLLRQIHERGFEVTIEATYSREILYGDAIVRAANSRTSIGSIGSKEKHVVWKRKLLTDRIYSQLISLSTDSLFEFYTNKEFFSAIVNEQLNIVKPELSVNGIQKSEKIRNKYVVIFPGTNEISRMWPSANFKEIADYLWQSYSYDIVLSGSKNESYLFDLIGNNFERRFVNLFGNTLTELTRLIADAQLVISNDTSAVHISAAVNTPVICISSGQYFGRFQPYPQEVFAKAFSIYPPAVMNELHNHEHLSQKYRYGSDRNINEVTPDAVKKVVQKILGTRNK